MCQNKMRVFKDDLSCTYTCSEVKELKNLWIEEFIILNRCPPPPFKDRALERYKEEIDDFLNKCLDVKQHPSEECPIAS